MGKFTFLIAILGGIATAIQAGVNGSLGKKIGVIEGTFISFLVGTVALFILMIFFGKGNILLSLSVPKWQLVGGLLGSVYIICMIYATPRLGNTAVFIAIITGQIIVSTLIDYYGVFGKVIPINGYRVTGLIFFVLALFFIYLSSE